MQHKKHKEQKLEVVVVPPHGTYHGTYQSTNGMYMIIVLYNER